MLTAVWIGMLRGAATYAADRDVVLCGVARIYGCWRGVGGVRKVFLPFPVGGAVHLRQR